MTLIAYPYTFIMSTTVLYCKGLKSFYHCKYIVNNTLRARYFTDRGLGLFLKLRTEFFPLRFVTHTLFDLLRREKKTEKLIQSLACSNTRRRILTFYTFFLPWR